MLSPELVLDSETLKYLLLFGCGAGLWVFARWASRLGGSDPSLPYPQVPELDAPMPARPALDPESALSFLPPDPRLGSIRIKGVHFSKFDALPGPADPKCFCDELFVELYDANTGYFWTQSYLVATPEGLADVLREKSWKYLRTGSVIIVRRYDLQDIREAVVDYIIEDQKLGSGDDVPREHAE